jgi:hypothetical protein
MSLRDYSEDDDFYTQGFEKKGVISVWAGLLDRSHEKNVDTLQDLCGVGYYRLSDQESNSFDYALVDLSSLLSGLSYSTSYSSEVMTAAKSRGIDKARRIVVQYDFAYDPTAVVRSVEEDPIFLGVFPYRRQVGG